MAPVRQNLSSLDLRHDDIKYERLFSGEDERLDPDALIAQELHLLSVLEREQILEEIHGVSNISVEEPDDFVHRSLESLELALAEFPTGKCRSAFDCAMAMNPEYVNSKHFRLMFLRTDRFEASKAAARMIRHFNYKLKLFGEEKLGKKITFEDLNEDDRRALYCGVGQFFGAKDVRGRGVAIGYPKLADFVTWENNLRARFYQVMAAIEDESTQRNGVVLVFFDTPQITLGRVKGKMYPILDGLPLRITACHFFVLNKSFTPFVRFYTAIWGKEFRKRVRVHVEDNYMRCLYVLQSFGINPELVPIGENGLPKVDKFLAWLDDRRMKEAMEVLDRTQERAPVEDALVASSPELLSSITVENRAKNSLKEKIFPTENDILVGHGQSNRLQKGNVILNLLVKKEVVRYVDTPSYFGKTCIVKGIVHDVHKLGMRFLRQSKCSEEWYVVDQKIAHGIVSCRFQNHIRKQNASHG